MPLNGLTSGIDNKLTFRDTSGILRFVQIESFTSKEDARTDKVIGMDGNVRHPKFHQGWSGSFVVDRTSNVMDNYIAFQEASYNLGLDQLPVTITQTISESDGSVSQYQYINCVLTMDNAGNYSGSEIVKQNFMFESSGRLRLVGG